MKNQKEEIKNKEIKEKIEKIKDNLEEKTEDLKKDLSKTTKKLKKEIKEKAEDIKEKTEEILNDVKDSSNKFDKKDITNNKLMACVAYIIPPIPYFLDKKSKWIKYHSIQGMNLLIVFIITSLIVILINSIIPISFIRIILRNAINIFAAMLAIIGIINVCNGEARELPVINKFKIIKK